MAAEPLATELCRHFRYKQLYYETGAAPADGGAVKLRTTHCWCNLTQREFGPDDEVVDVDDCVNGRGCYRQL